MVIYTIKVYSLHCGINIIIRQNLERKITSMVYTLYKAWKALRE